MCLPNNNETELKPYGRGFGRPLQCEDGWDRVGLMCFSPCPEGFHGGMFVRQRASTLQRFNFKDGALCVQDCPETFPFVCGRMCVADHNKCVTSVIGTTKSALAFLQDILKVGKGAGNFALSEMNQPPPSDQQQAVNSLGLVQTTSSSTTDSLGQYDQLKDLFKMHQCPAPVTQQ